MRLTKHFTLEEMNKENLPLAKDIVHNLGQLALFLEFVRMVFNHPIIVTSGYRSKQHNAEVGGKPNSLHMLGKAVDITCQNVDDFDRLVFCCERGRYCPHFYMEYSKKRLYIHLQFGDRESTPLNLLPYVPFNNELV